MLDDAMRGDVRTAMDAVARWGVDLVIPADADAQRAAPMIRSAIVSAAHAAATSPSFPICFDDHSWSHGGIRGLSLSAISDEMIIAADSSAASPKEWGIAARVAIGEIAFDVPIAMDLQEDAAVNIMAKMEGDEDVYVDLGAIARAFPDPDGVSVRFWAAPWGDMRDIGRRGSLPMDVSIDFRRPVVWDLLRARFSGLPPRPLPPFDLEQFHLRFAMSSRHDPSLIRSTRSSVLGVAKTKAEPRTAQWAGWLPAVCNMLSLIGPPKPMVGMSVVLNFLVEEPLVSDDGWQPVGYHNVIIAYGLHPLTAVRLLDLIREDPFPFYDLPQVDGIRYLLVGASVIQDSMLSMMRVSPTGRTGAYDLLVESETASAPVSSTEEPIPF